MFLPIFLLMERRVSRWTDDNSPPSKPVTFLTIETKAASATGFLLAAKIFSTEAAAFLKAARRRSSSAQKILKPSLSEILNGAVPKERSRTKEAFTEDSFS